MNRDEVRRVIAERGITCANVSDEELKQLRKMLSEELRKSGIYCHTAKLCRAKKDLKFIEMKTEQWERREAVSFNRDGFVGIAGWADAKNVQPLLRALVVWASHIRPAS